MLPKFLRLPGMEFLGVCPASLIYRVPVITEVIRAHRWCKGLGNSMTELYPNGIPAVVVTGLIEIEAGFNQAERERQDERERKRESQERAAKNPNNYRIGR